MFKLITGVLNQDQVNIQSHILKYVVTLVSVISVL